MSFIGFVKKMGRLSLNPGVQNLRVIPTKRLKSVIVDEGASNKVKGLYIYVNVTFPYKFTDISKILFSLCHLWVLSVD